MSGVAFGEIGQQRRQHRRVQIDGAQDEAATRVQRADARCFSFESVRGCQQVLHLRQEPVPGRGELHRPMEPIEQLEAQLGFELLDVLAQVGLRRPQVAGGASKSTMLDDACKTAQMSQFHDREILSWRHSHLVPRRVDDPFGACYSAPPMLPGEARQAWNGKGTLLPYQVVSADSHLELPPDRFTHRVPAKYRDRAPKRIKLADGGEAMTVENRALVLPGLSLSGGPPEALWPVARCWDTGNGAGPPEQRMREQDEDGIEAEVLFPGLSGPNFWRGIRDDDAYLAVVHAYNEFLAKDYCAVNPDRLLGLGVIPEVLR